MTQYDTVYKMYTIHCICFCVYVQSLFTMSVQQQSIQPFTEAEYDQLTNNFGDNAVRTDFTLICMSVCMCLSVLLSCVLKQLCHSVRLFLKAGR